MNRTINSRTPRRRAIIRTVSALAGISLFAALSGCGNNDTFAKVNGQVVTNKEVVHALERQTVQVPGGQPTNALRIVLDQIVGQKVILAEAAKQNLVPTDAAVEAYYAMQKKLFEAQFPGKDYEKAMREQGTAPDDIKKEFRHQLAESALYAKRLNLSDDEVKKAYDQLKASKSIGFPERYQLRLVLTPAGSSQFQEATNLLNQKRKFEEVARLVNPPQLKSTGGLMPQAVSLQQTPPNWQAKVQSTVVGSYFGPVDLATSQPGAVPQKAWVLVEKKLPKLDVTLEEAKPLVLRQIVMQKMQMPENQSIVNEIKNQKMAVKFEASDKMYESVWENLKDGAKTGMTQQGGMSAVPPPPGADMPGAAVAPK